MIEDTMFQVCLCPFYNLYKDLVFGHVKFGSFHSHLYFGGGGKLPLYRFLIETVLPQLGKAGEIWFHSLISPPRDGVVSSRRLAGLLTPGWPPGVNKGERSWGLCQTFCRIFALSQGRKGSASDSKVGGPQ